MNQQLILCLCLLLLTGLLHAQCPGPTGPNLLPKGDFGTGTDSLSADTSHFRIDSSLMYTTQVPPQDGFYTIAKNTSDWQDFAPDFWINTTDKFTGPDGYMLVINQGQPGLAYGAELTACPNITYTFSFHAINLYQPAQSDDTLPYLQLWINEQLVADFGEIPKDATWHDYTYTFTPERDSIDIQIRNPRGGGQGNDYALDDIQLRPCNPGIALTAANTSPKCPGDPMQIELANTPENGDWYYLLQLSIDAGTTWLDVDTPSTNTTFNLRSIPPSARYRAIIAGTPEDIQAAGCQYLTPPLLVDYADPGSCGEVIGGVGELCDGARGDNIFEDGDFGSGNTNILSQNPFLAPGYTYSTQPPPNDGSYTISNNTSSWGSFAASSWINIGDNSDDPLGYMMVVNASYEPGIFYQKTVTVCENTNYEFSADVISLNDPNRGSAFIEPNISFLINGTEVYASGNVPVDREWHNYGFTFTTRPGVQAIQLTLRNNAPGGFGNDLALDNISFRPCGPGAQIADTTQVCAGDPLIIPANVELTAEFPNLALQWQNSTDEGDSWQDLNDANATELRIEAPLDGEWYRLKLANNSFNLENPGCQFFSNYTIIRDGTDLTQLQDTICANQDALVGDATFSQTGQYQVTLPRTNDCDSIVRLDLLVQPTYERDTAITICEGDFFTFGENQLQTSGLYTEQLTTMQGCDSTVRLDLLVAPNYQFIDTVTVCYGETYEGRIYFADTLQTQNLISLAGCDSTASQYFEVLIGENITLTEYVCPGESFRGAPIQRDTLVSYGGFNGETCDTVSLINVLVYPDPPVEIEAPQLICAGDTASLSVGNYTSYEWSTGATRSAIQVTEEGTYAIEVVSENNCIFRDSVFLEVPDFSADLTAKNISCFAANDGQLGLIDLQDALPPFNTTLNGQPRGNTLRFAGLAPGDYQLALTDQNGCTFEASTILTEPELFQIDLPGVLDIKLGDSVMINAQVNRAAAEINWTPSTGLSCPDCLQLLATPTQSTPYRLTVRDSMGCTATSQLSINVTKQRDIYVPTAFSPNGDQINDLFYPFDDNQVDVVQLWQVLDRWGNLVWEARNTAIGSPELAWNGQHRGQPAAPGVYLWRAVIVYKDQAVRSLSGDVLLMR